jgi:hypothetical protein
MENLQKGLVNFFVSFISSHGSDTVHNDQLIKKMMTMKSVQSIIVKTMGKLEPIINEEIVGIKNSSKSSKSQSAIAHKSKLLVLAQDVQHLMNNYKSIQGKISGMLSIVDSIDFNVEHKPIENTQKESPRKLVEFLSSLTRKKNMSDYEFDEISDEIWSKHIEVEKMLKIEMEKYYNNLNTIENKYFSRYSAIKIKAGLKIQKLEQELKQIWDSFRLQLDKYQMLYEDKRSREIEEHNSDESIINQLNEFQIKDLSSAVSTIKNLFSVRKILEKRKKQDEKLVSGLTNKIKILTEKFNDLKDMNSKIIDNISSLSWCLEYLINKFNTPAAVKEKALKYIQKQKCQKLESLFKIEGIFEMYSIETVSTKFDELKEGIYTVSHSIKDESVKIKINKLIIESGLEEVDKTAALKNIQPAKVFSSKKGKSGKIGTKKEVKEKAVTENALDLLKKAMSNIDEEIKKTDKIVEENIAEIINSQNFHEPSTKEDEIYFKNKTNSRTPNKFNTSASRPSENPSKLDFYSAEEVHVENKNTQTYTPIEVKSTQASSEILQEVQGILSGQKQKKSSKTPELIKVEETDNMITLAVKSILIPKAEQSIQTDKDYGMLDFSTPNNTIIRGLMNKIKNMKSEKNTRQKKIVDSDIGDNLIIKKFKKLPPNDFRLFKTEVKEDIQDKIDTVETDKDRTMSKEDHVIDETIRKSDVIIKTMQEDLESPEITKKIEDPEKIEKAENREVQNPLENIKKSQHPEKILKNMPNPPISSSLIENNLLKMYQALNQSQKKPKKATSPEKEMIYTRNSSIYTATEQYKKEFLMQSQIKGIKKLGFLEIQSLWEEVINRRILEGENDRISIYLRGYLGTDKYESEKSRILSMIDASNKDDIMFETLSLSVRKKTSRILVENWKKIMVKLFIKQSMNFKTMLKPSDSPSDILFKAARMIKYVKHRINKIKSKTEPNKISKKSETSIMYKSDKWSVNTISLTPVNYNKTNKKIKFSSPSSAVERILRSKTPAKDKILTSEVIKFPQIQV